MGTQDRKRLVVSCDTAARLDAAAEWLRGYPRDERVLVVASSAEAADDFARSAARTGGAWFGLTRITPERLAVRLASEALASRGLAPASSLSTVATAARAVHLLVGEEGLTYFGPVATRPGFPVAAARTVQELRANRVAAADISGLPRAGPDLARLVERIESEFAGASLADRARIFGLAISELERERDLEPAGQPLLLIDLPVHSALDMELLAALARRAPAALATAARGDDRSIRNLELVLGATAVAIDNHSHSPSLVALKANLFEETTPPVNALDDSVALASWPGVARECVEIARSIQAEARKGVAFDRIAVFLRSPGEYRRHLEEAFRRAAIPTYFARGTTRPDPAGRALLALLLCAAEGLSARRFAEYVSLAQVPLDGEVESKWTAPQDELVPDVVVRIGADAGEEESAEEAGREGQSLPAPWRWEQLLVESAVIGGKDRWKRRLSGLEHELRLKRAAVVDEEETRARTIDRQLGDLLQLSRFALPLIDRLSALPERATWGEWLRELTELSRAALREPEGVLSTLAELGPMSPVGPVDLDEVLLVLRPRLRELGVPPPRRRYGAVFVASTDLARGHSFDVVFVPGLAEKIFPHKVVEDPILLDELRLRVNASGGKLITQRDRNEAERLALRLAVGAAARRVYLSYPRVDVEQARARVPSFYGLEAIRAAEGYLPGFGELGARAESKTVARLGWPAPVDPLEAIDEAEYDLSVLAPALTGDEEVVKGAATYLLSANPHLSRALRVRARRWLRRWTVADGLVDPDDLAREALLKHQLEARSYSPTALQNFAACPYKFFLQAVHRLAPLEEAVPLEVIDPLTRGSLFHDVQYEVLTELRSRGLLPVSASHLKEAIELVDAILDTVAERYRDRLAPAIPRVWEDGISTVRADLREWLRRAADSEDGWIPSRFELSFGLPDRDRPNEDPASVPEPVPVINRLRLRGSIDLVEHHIDGKLRATDHKTGKARAKTDVVIGGGEVLQPVLYALALEKLLDEPVESGRLYYCTSDGGYEERVVPLDYHSRECGKLVEEVIDGALKEGFLPAAPTERACDWCDYRLVCGPREVFRASRKPPDRLASLTRLRETP